MWIANVSKGSTPRLNIGCDALQCVHKRHVSFYWESRSIQLCCVNDSLLKPESHVKLLGVTLGGRLTFNEHVSICRSKATRQLNALSRRYLDTSSCSFLFSNFVKSNFNYCPMVWHFRGKVNSDKIENIQHKAPQIKYKDYVSSDEDLMFKANVPTMPNKRLNGILWEVFKSIKGINLKCLNDLFVVK